MPKRSPVSTVARNVKVSRTVTFGFWTLECLSASRCAVPAVSLKESKRCFGHCIWLSAEFSACWLAMIHFYSGEISICDMTSFSVLATRADVACNSCVGQGVSQTCRHRWRDNYCGNIASVTRHPLVEACGRLGDGVNLEACEQESRGHRRKPS